jgi:hypothetical protein
VAVTVDQLRAEFPEFAHTDSGLLAGKIADATAMLNAGAFGDLYDQAVKYMACHLIALSPNGEFARLDANDEPDGARTTYERTYLKLQRSIGTMMVV